VTVFRFVERERATFPVATMCRLLGVSTSGFWAWLRRGPSARSLEDARLTGRIRALHRASRDTYGSPRIRMDLRAEGIRVGRRRVARLMRAEGIRGISRRRSRPTTVRDPRATPFPDLVRRRFAADGPDRLWVADITELPTLRGPLLLASVLDAWSRRCVGWAMDPRADAALVIRALDMALHGRGRVEGLVHHSDHGTQYTSHAFRARLREAGIAGSMGRIGDSYDNAMAESFFASLETELIDRSRWHTHEAARLAVFDWIEGFYNRVRRHSALGHLSPMAYEGRYRVGVTAA
jgi:transposase InsO family protein